MTCQGVDVLLLSPFSLVLNRASDEGAKSSEFKHRGGVKLDRNLQRNFCLLFGNYGFRLH